MTNELLQQRHNELQQRIVLIRESLRQTEAKLQDLHDQEQQIFGALAVVREFIQLQPVEAQMPAAPPPPVALPPQIQAPSAPPVDNTAQ